jgi:hypothetical protein
LSSPTNKKIQVTQNPQKIKTVHIPLPANSKQHSRRTSKRQQINTKVSRMSKKKWQPQVQQFLNWTAHHMDAYLPIPQVVMEWIVDPG